jgi:hypothetical protein
MPLDSGINVWKKDFQFQCVLMKRVFEIERMLHSVRPGNASFLAVLKTLRRVEVASCRFNTWIHPLDIPNRVGSEVASSAGH